MTTARDAGALFVFGPSGVVIRAKSPVRREDVTVAWIYVPGRSPWMRTRDLTFGHGQDYPGTDPTLRAVLDGYYSDIANAGLGGDASSKGVRARWVTPDEAAMNLEFLQTRLTKIIIDLANL